MCGTDKRGLSAAQTGRDGLHALPVSPQGAARPDSQAATDLASVFCCVKQALPFSSGPGAVRSRTCRRVITASRESGACRPKRASTHNILCGSSIWSMYVQRKQQRFSLLTADSCYQCQSLQLWLACYCDSQLGEPQQVQFSCKSIACAIQCLGAEPCLYAVPTQRWQHTCKLQSQCLSRTLKLATTAETESHTRMQVTRHCVKSCCQP